MRSLLYPVLAAALLAVSSATFPAAAAPKTEAQRKVVAERIQALLAFERSSEIGNITVPTLIQGAEDDLIVPAYLQRELASLMPRATVATFPSGGHFFPVTRVPQFVDQLLRWAETVE